MFRRLEWFVLGILATIALIAGGAYVVVTTGGVPMATTARPLPFERALAQLALQASYASSAGQSNPLPVTDANLLAGVRVYQELRCTVCHGVPGQPRTPIAQGMFPAPPQLFELGGMVTEDPDGITFWKVTNGIRMTGMPGFANALSEAQRWQVVMLISHADKLPPAVVTALKR